MPGVRLCVVSWKGCPPRGGEGRGQEEGKNRREVIRRHLAQRSRLRRLKSGVGIGGARAQSDGACRAFSAPASSALVSMGTGPAKRSPGVRGGRHTDNSIKPEGSGQGLAPGLLRNAMLVSN